MTHARLFADLRQHQLALLDALASPLGVLVFRANRERLMSDRVDVRRSVLSAVDSKIRWLRSSGIRVKPTPAAVYPCGSTLKSASSVWRSTPNGSLCTGGDTAAGALSYDTRSDKANSGVRLSKSYDR